MTLASWEQQCVFYEDLRADMIAEQSALRQDMRAEQSAIRQEMSYGLAEIRRTLEERGNQVQTHVNVQPLVECVRTEVRNVTAKNDMVFHNGIGSVLDSLSKLEA